MDSTNTLTDTWKQFGARLSADAEMKGAQAKGTGAGAGGIILAGYAISKMAAAKAHVDQLCT